MPERYTTPEQIEEMRQEIRREKEKRTASGTVKKERIWRLSPGKLAVKTAGWVVFVSLVLLLAGTIVSVNMAKSRGEIPSLLGFQFFVIESGSMEPTLDIGSVILSKKIKDRENLKVNDIVTFKNLTGAVVTHRIVEVSPGEKGEVIYRTKGDNPRNSIDQDPLTPDRVLAVFVAKIPLT